MANVNLIYTNDKAAKVFDEAAALLMLHPDERSVLALAYEAAIAYAPSLEAFPVQHDGSMIGYRRVVTAASMIFLEKSAA